VVDPTSASPQLPGVTYYGIEANHSGMCKFESREAPGYRTVSTALRDWVREAPAVIQVRWVVEEEDRLARAMQEVDERMRPFVSVTTSPVRWRRNESRWADGERRWPLHPELFGPLTPLNNAPRQRLTTRWADEKFSWDFAAYNTR
jgi:hypothetical protein